MRFQGKPGIKKMDDGLWAVWVWYGCAQKDACGDWTAQHLKRAFYPTRKAAQAGKVSRDGWVD